MKPRVHEIVSHFFFFVVSDTSTLVLLACLLVSSTVMIPRDLTATFEQKKMPNDPLRNAAPPWINEVAILKHRPMYELLAPARVCTHRPLFMAKSLNRRVCWFAFNTDALCLYDIPPPK